MKNIIGITLNSNLKKHNMELLLNSNNIMGIILIMKINTSRF